MPEHQNDLLMMTTMLEKAGYIVKPIDFDLTGFDLGMKEYMVRQTPEGDYLLYIGKGEIGDMQCMTIFAFDRKTHRLRLHGSNHFDIKKELQ